MTVAAIFGVLIPHHVGLKAGGKSAAAGSKRPASEMMDDATDRPGAKLRLIMSGGAGGDDEFSAVKSDPASTSKGDDAPSPHPVSQASAAFLRLLHSCVVDSAVTPLTRFAVRFLEQCVKRSWTSSKSPSSPGRSRLVLQHLSTQMVLYLVKTVPNLFTVSFTKNPIT